jgi:4-diphosphocytidyl-2-C-methyl-D-erythritol kinase
LGSCLGPAADILGKFGNSRLRFRALTTSRETASVLSVLTFADFFRYTPPAVKEILGTNRLHQAETMHLSNYLHDVVVWAPAKVNLFLEVHGKRPDGYHEFATLMVAVRLYDTLIFRKTTGPGITLQCTNPQLSTGPDNLVLRAATLLQQKAGLSASGAHIRLVKRIPLAAGLAGGSTDAAGTLLGLNRLWQLGISNHELAKLGGELGSDIPFFFHTPAAWCTGRGEIVTKHELGAPLEIVLVCPPFGMPTAGVYKNVIVPSNPESGDAIRQALRQGDVTRIGSLLHNRLQPAAEKLNTRIGVLDQLLAKHHPAGHRMSGSGSTLFALCSSPEDAQRLHSTLKQEAQANDCKLILTRSL